MIKSPPYSPLYVIPMSCIAFRYQKMVFTNSVYYQEGFLAKRLITDIAKVIFGLVSTIKNISNLVLL